MSARRAAGARPARPSARTPARARTRSPAPVPATDPAPQAVEFDGLSLGIDLGTSAVKLAACTSGGTVLASAGADFPTLSEQPGQAEQDPQDWLRALGAAARTLGRALRAQGLEPGECIGAIGLAGQLPTLVCEDASGPAARAITWKDSRADAWATATLDATTRRQLYQRTGMPVDGRYLGPMFRHHGFHRRRDLQHVCSAKDWLCHVLSAARVTDPSTAAGYAAYDLAQRRFAADLCALWDLPPGLLPEVRPAHARAGALTAGGAGLLGLRAGVPVTVGAADSVAGAYAMGALAPGTVSIAMGSSTIILDAVQQLLPDPAMRYLLSPHVEPGWYAREMDLLATGTGYAWLSQMLNVPAGELNALAASAPPGARGLFFSPYLAGGEQGALWDPTLTGTLRGLTVRHSRADIARAFLEGVAYEIRRCLDVLAANAPVGRVVVSGGITSEPQSLQRLADILQRPIEPCTLASPAAVGAARGAWAMLRLPGSAPPASPSQAPARHPGPEAELYRGLYGAYLALPR